MHPPRPVCVAGVLPRLLCVFCRGGSRRPPAPPAPAKRDWYWRCGIPCVLVEGNVSQIFTRCRLFWRQSGFDLRHACHIPGSIPGPLTAACNARLYFVQNYSSFFQNHSPAFCFFECQLKKRKAYPKRFEKGSGGAGGGGKNFPQKFFPPPPPNRVCFKRQMI